MQQSVRLWEIKLQAPIAPSRISLTKRSASLMWPRLHIHLLSYHCLISKYSHPARSVPPPPFHRFRWPGTSLEILLERVIRTLNTIRRSRRQAATIVRGRPCRQSRIWSRYPSCHQRTKVGLDGLRWLLWSRNQRKSTAIDMIAK